MIGAIILQIVLIILNATFASAEIAVISMNEVRLRKLVSDGDKRAIRLAWLTDQPSKFLATIQVAITLAGLLGSAFAADNFAGPLVSVLIGWGIPVPARILNTLAVFLITLILAYFNLVFGELVPKRIAMKKAEAMALGMSGLLYSVSRIFAPVVFLLTGSTNLILRLFRIDPEADSEMVSEEEIRMMLMEGSKQGTIDQEETTMINNIFAFDDTSVAQICTHRVDVVSLYMEDSVDEWDEQIHTTRHTFYPVCGDNSDDIIGILDTKDYFRLEYRTKETITEQIMKAPYYVPESMKANVLFRNMRKKRSYFAVILDEYGGMSGIITLHDLLEELVGELHETEEEKAEAIKQIDENTWQIQGYADLSDVGDCLNVSLPVDSYDTFNGFIWGEIGKVPGDGESFEFETPELKVRVHAVENHKVTDATVWLKPDRHAPEKL